MYNTNNNIRIMNKLILLVAIGFIWSAIYASWEWSKWWLIPISIIFIFIELAVLASSSDDEDNKGNGTQKPQGKNITHND